jgi:hypothetical protein
MTTVKILTESQGEGVNFIGNFKGTRGPWRWELNIKSKDINLCGYGKYGPFDLTVMDFERWGMGGAVPRFRNDECLMQKAFEFAQVHPKREHHKDWFQLVKHPDATLIEQAYPLAAELQNLVDACEGFLSDDKLQSAKNVLKAALGMVEPIDAR